LGQWEELNVFLADGTVARNEARSVEQKNSLFVGNVRSGRTAAILASLTPTYRRHDLDPQLYLTQLLLHLPALRISDRLAARPLKSRSENTAGPSPGQNPQS
jgi:hypothetical protein